MKIQFESFLIDQGMNTQTVKDKNNTINPTIKKWRDI